MSEVKKKRMPVVKDGYFYMWNKKTGKKVMCAIGFDWRFAMDKLNLTLDDPVEKVVAKKKVSIPETKTNE